MTKTETTSLQHALNAFTKQFLRYVTPLRVDGDYGQATKKRLRLAHYYLGYPTKKVGGSPDFKFRRRLKHPHGLRYSTPWQQATGANRRSSQRKHAKKNVHVAASTSGVGTYNGVPCANWLIPYLNWARDHGWDGRLNSGWRDPRYSESLCRAMCGAARCPGRCAGRSSNHSGSVKPAGAVDVSSYVEFGHLMARCPLSPKLVNHLPRDLVHWSASGF